jgi:hypothetical protein
MKNSCKDHSLGCEIGKAGFGEVENMYDSDTVIQTSKQRLQKCREEFKRTHEDEIRRGLKSETKHFRGVNCDQLLDFDRQ